MSSGSDRFGSRGPTYTRPQDDGRSCDICLSLLVDKQVNKAESVRIEFAQLAESAGLEDCLYCALVYHSLVQHGARIDLDGYSLVTVHARKEKPIFVCWEDIVRGRSVLEVYDTNRECPWRKYPFLLIIG